MLSTFLMQIKFFKNFLSSDLLTNHATYIIFEIVIAKLNPLGLCLKKIIYGLSLHIICSEF